MIQSLFRKSKLAYQVYNLFNKKALAYNVPLYKKYGLHKKYYHSVSSADFENIKTETVHTIQDSKTYLPKNKYFQTLNKAEQEAVLSWSKNGYVILKNFISENVVDQINAEVEYLIDSKKAKWQNINKIMFAIHYSDLIYNTATNPKLMAILEMLLEKKIDLFQSINFKTGSQQRAHSDSIHMTTFPYGNIIAVWIALEDIKAENGPLHYYPGSHKLPYVMNKDIQNEGSELWLGDKNYDDYEDKIEEIIKTEHLKKEVFLARKGDLLIWHANLLHGGEPTIDKKGTRKSMVFHYYAQDAICFHEITQRPTLKRINS